MSELRRKGRIIVSLPGAGRKKMSRRRLDPGQDQDWEDPIVKEVHETRARILASFGGDFHAYVKYIEGVQAEKKKQGVQYASPPPRRPAGWEPPAGEKPDAA